MAKIIRTSFAHMVREKIIQSEDELLPDPILAKDIVPVRMNNSANGEKIFDSDKFGGSLLYREADVIHTDGDDTWKIQGPVGYGSPPVGPGTKPYYTMLTNAVNNTDQNTRGVYTGSVLSPHIPEFNIFLKGNIPFGATWSIGQLEQSYTNAAGTVTDVQCGAGRHVLMSLDSRLRTISQLTGAGKNTADAYSLDDTGIPHHVDNAIHFIYESTGVNTYEMYAVRGDITGYNSTTTGVIDSLPKCTGTIQATHLINSYKRLLPVHFKLNPDGSGEFRVETTTMQFSVTSMPGKDGSNFAFPTGINSGDSHASHRIAGMDPRRYTAAPVRGMTNPLVVLGNLAVNDTDNTDALGDTGLPPFIAGIPMTPIRRNKDHDDASNERPVSVVDKQKQAGGDDAWVPYSYSGAQVNYVEPLEAVVDGQAFDIYGVATNALSADLDITLDYNRIENRHDDINAVNIEAINISVENAAVFGPAPDTHSLVMSVAGDTGGWTTDFKKANKLTTDSELDSHVTFFSKTDTMSNSLTGFRLDDFNDQLIVKIRAMLTSDLP